MIEWQYDSMVVLQHGCMAAWQHGGMAVWQHGGMAAWQLGSMAAQRAEALSRGIEKKICYNGSTDSSARVQNCQHRQYC
jgi:hypothetical protein